MQCPVRLLTYNGRSSLIERCYYMLRWKRSSTVLVMAVFIIFTALVYRRLFGPARGSALCWFSISVHIEVKAFASISWFSGRITKK